MASVDRLERWTSGLLAYLLPIKPALTHVNLEKILEGGLIALTQKLHEKHIKIVKNINAVQQQITTDEHLLEQVIYNLVLNAVDASPKNSTINIDAKLENSHLILVIKDEGSGIPFAPDPHVLSPGPSTKRFGTGLGIPFAFKVCEVLGGKITFEASPPQGTYITLTLPQ
jgi:signal transduction histidine kinase